MKTGPPAQNTWLEAEVILCIICANGSYNLFEVIILETQYPGILLFLNVITEAQSFRDLSSFSPQDVFHH